MRQRILLLEVTSILDSKCHTAPLQALFPAIAEKDC